MKKISFVISLLLFFALFAYSAFAQCYVNGKEIPCDIFWANYGWIFVGAFLIIGLTFLIKPDWMLKFQIWSAKAFMGAKYAPSKRTRIIVRAFGAVFTILGLIFLYLSFIQ